MKKLQRNRHAKGSEKSKRDKLAGKAVDCANDVMRDMEIRVTQACRSGRVLDELNISGLFLKELPNQAKLVRFARIKAGNNLFKEIPSYLSTITRLQNLDFRHNILETIPEYLLHQTCLKGVNLSDNRIQQFPGFAMKLNHITALNLSFNRIRSFHVPSECLQKLESLLLSHNAMTSIDVEYCTTLQFLDCGHNLIAKSSDMSIPYSLVSLMIDNIPMNTFPMGLDATTGLTELSWANSGLERMYGRGPSSTILKVVKDMVLRLSIEKQSAKTIRFVGLANSESCIERNMERIKSAQKLQIVGFVGNIEQSPILSTIFSNASRESLSIMFSSLKIVPSMDHMTALRHLNVSNNDIEGFTEPLPECLSSMSISNCKITKIDAFILNCRSLTSLDLSFNQLEFIPTEITRLDALMQLSCDHCRLIKFPSVLLWMQALVMISLRNNLIENSVEGDVCRPEFSNDVINSIDLSNNFLRQPPKFLLHLISVRYCAMWNNPLEQPWVQFATEFQPFKWTKLLQTEVLTCEMQSMKLIDNSVLTVAFPQTTNHLTNLDISANNLTILPPWLSGLNGLKLLNAKCNKLNSASYLVGCNGLVRINLAYNVLKLLPQEAFDLMMDLKEVILDGNPLKHLPQILFSRKTLKPSIQWCVLPVTNQRLLRDHSIKMSILHDLMKSLFTIQEGVSSIKLQGKRLTAVETAWFTNKLARLDTISSISIGSNMIAEFPTCFTMLHNLTEVDISVNRLKELPQWMAKLRSLKKLVCFSNMIKNILWDAAFQSMREIDISDNKLNEIPEDLCMIKFSSFSARYNSIDKFQSHPGFWGKTLEVLDLEYNLFTILPLWVSELTTLQYLNLEGNYLKTIPLELFSITSLQDLRLPSMESAEHTELNDDDDKPEEIATPKSHSVHWLAVLKRLNESMRTLKMDLDDLSLMELPEQVLHSNMSIFENIHSFFRHTQ
jgi:Leucine-rich repeat (LRR) protein